MEEVKQTQNVHSTIMPHSLQNQLYTKNGIVSQQLPEALSLPICIYEEVEKVKSC